MKSRIEQILHKYQLSSAQFADIIGVQRSSISHILSGRNKPSFDFIHKIMIKYPEINADWLITGRGNLNNEVKEADKPITSVNKQNLFKQSVTNQPITPKSNTLLQESNSINKSQNISEDFTKNDVFTNVNSVKSIIFLYEDDSFKIINSR